MTKPDLWEVDEDADAKQLCLEINQKCSCFTEKRPACDSMVDLVQNVVTAAQERQRMAEGGKEDDDW